MYAPVYRNLDAPSTFLGLAFPMEWLGVLGAGWVGTALGAPNVGAGAALAQAADMPGQQLLQFARNYIIAPLALFAIVISGVAAFIRPEMIKSTAYVAIIAVVLYFLLANADRLLQVMRAG